MDTQQSCDVAIIGGGVIGCSIAYQLRKAGVDVLVIERQEVAAEASSAAAGLLAPFGSLTEPGPFSDLVLASWALAPTLLPQIEQESGVQVEYRRVGALHIAANDREVEALRQQMQAWEALGAKMTWLTEDETREREPLLGSQTNAPIQAAIFIEGEGSIKAPAVARAYAEAARRAGTRFALATDVVGIIQSGSRVVGVRTAQGEMISCQRLVIAGGAWSASCGEWLGLTIPVVPMKGQILSLGQPEPALQHIIFSEDVYFVPKLDGTIFIGATVEQVGFDKRLTAGGIAWLLNSAIRLIPALEQATIVQLWSGLRTWSRDSQPVLGQAPGWENVILATGHSAMGFELSAITGKMIAELITSGQTPELIRPFGIERFLEQA
jgi:glycine oxidase